MTKRMLLLTGTLLSACAWIAPSHSAEYPTGDGKVQTQAVSSRKATYCGSGSTCTVTVTVDASCGVTVDPYVFVVGGTMRPVTITWKIDGNAAFHKTNTTYDGIYFKELEGQKQFHVVKAGPSEIMFTDHGHAGIYHYGVKVVQGGQDCLPLDPTGVNDM
jgi:uncharacterized membrane protein